MKPDDPLTLITGLTQSNTEPQSDLNNMVYAETSLAAAARTGVAAPVVTAVCGAGSIG
jgi:hypothetical protein